MHGIIAPIKFHGHCRKYAEQNDNPSAVNIVHMIVHASLLFHHFTVTVSIDI